MIRKLFSICLVVIMLIVSSATARAYDDVNKTYYPKASAPDHLYVIESDNMSLAEASMIASLQGIIAKTKPEIYILPESSRNGGADRQAYMNWLTDMQQNYGVTYQTVTSPWTLIDTFKQRVNGYILYSYEDNSLNPATNISAITNAIVVEDSIQSTANSHGLTMNTDVRGKTEQWVYDNYWSSFRNDMAFEQSGLWQQLSPGSVGWGSHATLRDYSVFSNSFMFFGQNSYPLRNTILSSLADDSPLVGYGDFWNLGEDGMVSPISQTGNFLVAANHSFNISTLSGIQTASATQHTHQPTYPDEENVHYVTLIWSDGDNPQWEMGTMPTMNTSQFSWWANPNRGQWNMGWGISASLIDMAPSIVKWYYDDASNGTYKDDFVVYGPGGYTYPSLYPASELVKNAQRLNDYMERLDTGSLVVIDKNSMHNTALWDNYTSQQNIKGIFYLDYSSYHLYNGQINWSNNKPVISARYSLWDGIQDETTIANAINGASRDVHSSNAYSMISVHAWSKTMNDVKDLIDSLGSDVRVVTPEVFIQKVTNNVQDTSFIPGADAHGYKMYDDFTSGVPNGWTTNDGTWAVESGEYSGTADASAQSYALAGDSSWSNYDFHAGVRLVSGANDAGLAFRAEDVNNNYTLAIRSGNIQLYKRVNGVYASLGLANTTNNVGTRYNFIISVKGSNITVSKNNVQLLNLIDSTFTSGKAGLRTCGGTHAHFDDVKVYDNVASFSNALLYDGFEDGDTSNWTVNDGVWTESSGYISGTGNIGYQSYALTGDAAWTDYTYEADVQLKSGTQQDAGLAFRAADVNNHYLLAIRSSGVELYKRVNGTYTSLGTAATANTTDTWYKYIISVSGNGITVTKDTVVLMNVTDSTFSSGKIGLRASGGTNAYFDMAKVTSSSILLSDNFDSGSAENWSSSNGTWTVESGEYSGTADAGAQSYSLKGNTQWTDYTFLADVNVKSGTALDAGIAFRAADVNNHYLLAIGAGSSGALILYKRVNGNYIALTSVSASIPPDTFKTFRIVLAGTSIKVYMEDTFMIDATDSTFGAGNIGLRTCGGTHAHFDNISVTG